MEKTKKLFVYIVAFAAVLSLFFTGMTMQAVASFAAEEAGFRPSISQKAAPNITTIEAVTGTGNAFKELSDAEIADILKELKMVPISEVSVTAEKEAEKKASMTEAQKAEYDTDKEDLQSVKAEFTQLIKQDRTEAEAVFGKEAVKAMDDAAKEASDDVDSDYTYDHSVMVVTDIVKVELGDILGQVLEETGKPVAVTFDVDADVVLFKSAKTGAWKALKIVYKDSGSQAAAPIKAVSSKKTTVEMDETDGVLVFQKVSADAEKIMKAKEEAKPTEEAKCDKCGENCPFCKYLCKDGVCYCWTVYLAIALAVILLILAIALAIVKAKAKKAADIQVPEEDEEIVGRRPAEEEEKPEDQNGPNGPARE